MRKVYLLASLILLGSAVIAQVAPSHPLKFKSMNSANRVIKPNLSIPSSRTIQPANHPAAVIWSDDFSNPANWAMASESTSSDNWIIDAVGPVGPFTIGPIASTSAANGWATFDSDNMCSGDQIGDLTNVTAINCTGHPAVNLKFEEYYRRYSDSTFVFVSNDGTNWTQFQISPNQTWTDNGNPTTNPTNVTVNISSVAGNQATVWIRFQFWSPAGFMSAPGCGYAWEIDDVSIEDLPADDIGIVPIFPSKYADIPLSQVQPIALSAQITNAGGATETNVGFNAYVLQYVASAWTLLQGPTSSNTAASLAPLATSAMLTAGNWTPPDTGLYAFIYIDFMTNTDANGLNDTLVNYIIVTDSMYAKDYTDIDGMVNNALGFNTSVGKLANVFDIYTSRTVTSCTFFLGNATLLDTVTASVYSVTGGGAPNAALATTANHIITPLDTNNWVTLSFYPTAPVVPVGKVAIVLNQISAIHNIALGFDANINTPLTAFYKTTGAWAAIDTSGFPGSFVLRPNLNMTTNVSENEYSQNVLVYPNPANGKVYIHNSNTTTPDYTINVYNSVGEVVYSKYFNNMLNAVIDFGNMSNGIYTIQMKSDANIVTKSIVISNNK